MINYPKNWREIGHRVTPGEIESAICDSIREIGVRNISLSGGIDSTLLLYFMKQILGNPIHCYTIAVNEKHPDYLNAKRAAEFFDVSFHPYLIHKTLEPNDIVRAFYGRLSEHGIREIIAGDGIDEFSCGYYSHQDDPSEDNYINWIRKLNEEQLIPLNENSGDISVSLPYLSPNVISLFSLVPIYEKVDHCNRKKIIVLMARGNIPECIVYRRKYGFCDATTIKEG
jgi:asparagine synthetase B (glutamine-hydrolysing)